MCRNLLLLLLSSFISSSLQAPRADEPGSTALDNYPLVDGHNDLPFNLYSLLKNQIADFNFDQDLSNDAVFGFDSCKSCFTDLPRIKKGKLGAQFWVAYVSCDPTYYNTSVSRSYEQVDVIKRLIASTPTIWNLSQPQTESNKLLPIKNWPA
jgi:microsomal dipeptidase-like Zn-dependent dipeptidase